MELLNLRNPWPGAPILFRERTGSTMEDALALARDGYQGGTTVVADYQEAGRGRLAVRRWRSEAGKNLLFTQLLRDVLPEGPQRLPLLVGLAVSRALEASFAMEPVIKWPNDVLCRLPGGRDVRAVFGSEGAFGSGRDVRAVFGSEGALGSGRGVRAIFGKVAGILCEAVTEGCALVLLAGVGLNCNQLEFPAEPGAVSLARLLGREVERLQLLERILEQIRVSLAERDWKAALLERLHYLGREVIFRQEMPGNVGSGRTLRGVLDGVEDDGALRLRLPGGRTTTLYSGEITEAR
jgi:BirA family biotin operon repressor/biotin-[acetyl-CoA-carboxylase] ligase